MLRIVKGGRLYYQYEGKRWNNVTSNLPGFLSMNPFTICEIDEGVTLNDIFLLIKRNKDALVNILHPEIDSFLKEIRKKPTGECDGLDHLEIYWAPGLDEDESETIMYDDPHIHLVKDIPVPTGDPDEDFPYYGIMFTAINEMKNMPVKLNKKFELNSFKNYKKHKVVLSTTKDFHLIEILSCIFWEITWFGNPENRNKEKAELRKDIGQSKRYS